MKMCIVWMSPRSDNVPRFIMLLDVSLILNSFICFCWLSVPSLEVLGKTIASLTTQQARENNDFYLRNYHNYKISNSSCCPHADPRHPLPPKKRAKLLSFSMSQSFISIPVASVNYKFLFGPAVHIGLPQNLKWLYRFTVLFTLVLCLEIGSCTCKLSKLHQRSIQHFCEWCMNVNDTFPLAGGTLGVNFGRRKTYSISGSYILEKFGR